MKKLSICLASVFFGCFAFMGSTYAKVRSYTFEYSVTNHIGFPLEAQKVVRSRRVISAVHFSPSNIVAPGQTMKITGFMDIDGVLLRSQDFVPTDVKITFSLMEGFKEKLLDIVFRPTYLQGIITQTKRVENHCIYLKVTKKNSIDITSCYNSA